jgi:hypothetical protein
VIASFLRATLKHPYMKVASCKFPGEVFSGECDGRNCRHTGAFFVGDLVVRKRAVIRATAHVSGTITYGEIDVELGATVAGLLMPGTNLGTDFLPPAFARRLSAARPQDPTGEST